MAKFVLDLVPQLDMPGQILVGDEDPTDWTGLLRHQCVLDQLLLLVTDGALRAA